MDSELIKNEYSPSGWVSKSSRDDSRMILEELPNSSGIVPVFSNKSLNAQNLSKKGPQSFRNSFRILLE